MTELDQGRHLRWTHLAERLPLAETDWFDFCLEAWNTRDSVTLLVDWFASNTRLKTDTLQLGCTSCWQPQADSLFCNADGSYTYDFIFRNESGFTVDFLSIFETPGEDYIAQDTIPLSAPLPPGASTPPISLAIDASVVEQGRFCLGLTPRKYRQDSIAIACCSATYCLPLPPCDTCCTAYMEYQDDVDAGFQIMGNCETRTLTLMANALNECDRVHYTIVGLGGGTVDGNETFEIGGLMDEVECRVCMEVTRENLSGENCYAGEGENLVICQSYYFNCDFCFEENNIDLENECPVIVDAVCGCDEMTYLNACTAFNWGGLNFWNQGCCPGTIAQIDLDTTITPQGFVILRWTATPGTILRYFLVQRRAPGGVWFTLNQLPPQQTTYTDNTPLQPSGEYRLLAVTESGKLWFSEDNPDCVVSTNEVQVLAGGRVWPNPGRDWIEVELPVAAQSDLQVYGVMGQLIHQARTDRQGKTRLQVHTWPPGTYWIIMRQGPQRIWRQAFVRQP